MLPLKHRCPAQYKCALSTLLGISNHTEKRTEVCQRMFRFEALRVRTKLSTENNDHNNLSCTLSTN